MQQSSQAACDTVAGKLWCRSASAWATSCMGGVLVTLLCRCRSCNLKFPISKPPQVAWATGLRLPHSPSSLHALLAQSPDDRIPVRHPAALQQSTFALAGPLLRIDSYGCVQVAETASGTSSWAQVFGPPWPRWTTRSLRDRILRSQMRLWGKSRPCFHDLRPAGLCLNKAGRSMVRPTDQPSLG